MIQKPDKGRQIRSYFIEAEKEFRAIATPEQIRELYKRLSILESKKINYTDDWAIDRYLRVNKLFPGQTANNSENSVLRRIKRITAHFPKKCLIHLIQTDRMFIPMSLLILFSKTGKQNSKLIAISYLINILLLYSALCFSLQWSIF